MKIRSIRLSIHKRRRLISHLYKELGCQYELEAQPLVQKIKRVLIDSKELSVAAAHPLIRPRSSIAVTPKLTLFTGVPDANRWHTSDTPGLRFSVPSIRKPLNISSDDSGYLSLKPNYTTCLSLQESSLPEALALSRVRNRLNKNACIIQEFQEELSEFKSTHALLVKYPGLLDTIKTIFKLDLAIAEANAKQQAVRRKQIRANKEKLAQSSINGDKLQEFTKVDGLKITKSDDADLIANSLLKNSLLN